MSKFKAISFRAIILTDRTFSGDFNGDGFSDTAAFEDFGGGITALQVWLSNGSAFVYSAAWWSYNSYDANLITGRVVCGDFNGDGKDDIAAVYDYLGGDAAIHVWLSTGSSFSYQSNSGWWFDYAYGTSQITWRIVAGDFNGDGKDDIAAAYDYGMPAMTIHVWLSTGSSFVYQSNSGWYSNSQYGAERITGRMVAGDFNGDGKDDIAAVYDYLGGNTAIHVWLSTFSSFAYQGNQGWWKNF